MPDKRDNPVAMAVGRAKLHSAMTDAKINLYLLKDGEDCRSLISGLADALGIVGLAAELQAINKHTEPPKDLGILRGGLSACKQLLRSGSYDTLQTVAIIKGLDASEQLNRNIKTRFILRAMQMLKT